MTVAPRSTRRWARLAVSLVVVIAAACAAPQPTPTPDFTGDVIVAPQRFTSNEMGRDLPVYAGIDQWIVDLGGAAWDTMSAGLGQEGTTILFGHRVSHGGAFRLLGNLQPGATVDLQGSDGHTYVYEVTRSRVTAPDWAVILDFQPASGKGLTLVACHPVGSTSQRLVVDAELLVVL